MKKIKLLSIILLAIAVTGCGGGKDLSKYDKVELTKDNIYDYIDGERLSGSYDGKTTHLTYQFESAEEGLVFEDVSFDAKIIECYKYKLLGIEVSDNIYVERNKVKLDDDGESSEISVSQSVDHQITNLCSAGSFMYTADNIKGYVYIPWDSEE